MCTNPIELKRTDKVTNRIYSHVVPCGKCPECLNRKQNDNAVLSYLEACKRGQLVFVTLTYNNDSFPMRERIGICRCESHIADDGLDIEWQSSGFVSHERLPVLRKTFVEHVGEDFSKVLRTDVLRDSSGQLLVYECSASLRRADFRDYLKRERIRYERLHGVPVPDFSYMCVGEYGEQHHRPHYHVCFYGLAEDIVRELCQNWTKLYGYIDVKLVQRFTSEPTHDGFFAASRYLGKYLTKGDSDSYNVLCGIAEKSRVLRSIGFGIPDRRQLSSLLSFSVWKIMQDIHSKSV